MSAPKTRCRTSQGCPHSLAQQSCIKFREINPSGFHIDKHYQAKSKKISEIYRNGTFVTITDGIMIQFENYYRALFSANQHTEEAEFENHFVYLIGPLLGHSHTHTLVSLATPTSSFQMIAACVALRIYHARARQFTRE